MTRILITLCYGLLLLVQTSHLAAAPSAQDGYRFNDRPVVPEVEYPDWFKKSFLELRDDLDEAVSQGKKGIIVYFGQKHCAYCQALMKHDFGQADIEAYTRKHFDVIALDIWGSKEVVTLDGAVMTERAYALREKANFTPTLIYYDADGRKALVLYGYYPPYKFRAAMEYVVQGYYKDEPFRQYVMRVEPLAKFSDSSLNEEDFFQSPPYALDRSRFKAQKPLLVLFEQPDCYACDLLHSYPLRDQETLKLLKHFDVVQLNMNADTPVLTPDGQKLTARRWAKRLNLIYAPTIIAFDENGREVIRIDSVAHIYRLRSVLRFVVDRTYLETPNYSSWRFDVLFGGRRLPKFKKPD